MMFQHSVRTQAKSGLTYRAARQVLVPRLGIQRLEPTRPSFQSFACKRDLLPQISSYKPQIMRRVKLGTDKIKITKIAMKIEDNGAVFDKHGTKKLKRTGRLASIPLITI